VELLPDKLPELITLGDQLRVLFVQLGHSHHLAYQRRRPNHIEIVASGVVVAQNVQHVSSGGTLVQHHGNFLSSNL